MTRKKRLTILFIVTIVFLLVAPATIFYSLGYRFNWETKTIVKTGALFLYAQPDKTEIYVDGKLRKRTGVLFSSAFIENLLPKKYKVEAKKEGYYSWEKILEVKEQEVAEARHITLIPQKLELSLLGDNLQNFFVSPDGKKIIWSRTNQNGWNLELFDPQNNGRKSLANHKSLSITTGEITDIQWSPQLERVLLTIENEKGQEKYFIVYLVNEEQIFVVLDFLPSGAEKVAFHPSDEQKIFFANPFKKTLVLYSANIKTKEISTPLFSNLIDYQIVSDHIVWLSTEGFVFENDLSGNVVRNFNTEPLVIKEGTNYQLDFSDDKLRLLQDGQTTYWLDQGEGSFRPLGDNIKGWQIAPDRRKIVFFNNYEIHLFFLERHLDTPRKMAGEKLFLTRFSQEIDNICWYTPYYLVFTTGNTIKVMEIDNRDNINVVDLTSADVSKLFYDNKLQTLYLLINGDLFATRSLEQD